VRKAVLIIAILGRSAPETSQLEKVLFASWVLILLARLSVRFCRLGRGPWRSLRSCRRTDHSSSTSRFFGRLPVGCMAHSPDARSRGRSGLLVERALWKGVAVRPGAIHNVTDSNALLNNQQFRARGEWRGLLEHRPGAGERDTRAVPLQGLHLRPGTTSRLEANGYLRECTRPIGRVSVVLTAGRD